MELTPVPTEEEAAAITAAFVLLDRPAAPAAPPPPTEWRFSGRWWHRASRYARR